MTGSLEVYAKSIKLEGDNKLTIDAAIFLAAALEFIAAEAVKLAGRAA
ncbi:uncharacterized protein FFE2_12684 [Fusarium fujikuroi]|nr:uncharacterized protein FFE2_12684 [Fusarium fujikuroi]